MDRSFSFSEITLSPGEKLAIESKQDTIIASLSAIAGLIPSAYDYVICTYVAAGNGVGQVETAIYKTGGAGGSTVATLSLVYDSSHRISTITKT
ncbi:MAG: hypothetical protein NUV80_00595 [Candidatus Berkelbacteria bacterium]|nr:hypothetical protein [Candidatus Berkelbacteria bacterium]